MSNMDSYVGNSSDPLAVRADITGTGWVTMEDLFIVMSNMDLGGVIVNLS
jgi:hypothetical protein